MWESISSIVAGPWGSLIAGGIGLLIPPAVVKFVPNKTLYAWGKKAGTAVTRYMTKKFGKNWNKVEKTLQDSFLSLSMGFQSGLDSDDKAKK